MEWLGSTGVLAATAIAALLVATPASGEEMRRQKQLLILNAIAETDAELLTINGENFGEGVPEVTLSGGWLEVLDHDPSQILVRLPAGIEPGSYLLTVSRGRGRRRSDAFDVSVGAQGDSAALAALRSQLAAVETRVDELTASFSPPTMLYVDRLTVEEGRPARIVVGLSHASVFQTAVDFRTVDGTAIAGTHYETVVGTLVFEAGETSKEIEIPTVGNFRIGSPLVSFAVELTNPVRAVLPSPAVDVDIVDDGDRPHVYVLVNNATEGAPLTASVWVTEVPELHCSVGGSVLYPLPSPVTLTLGPELMQSWHAQWGVDILWDGVIEIPTGTRATTVQLGSVVDDELVEGVEYIRSRLLQLDGEATFVSRCLNVRGQVFDND